MEYIWNIICEGWWIMLIMGVLFAIGRYVSLNDDEEYESLNMYYKQITDEYDSNSDESNI